MAQLKVTGNLADISNRKIYNAEIIVEDGKIKKISHLGIAVTNAPFILPGFIDSHVHIESSMLIPSEFARLAVVHGTVATISDPHEIANVCGVEGVNYMIENGKKVNFKFNFGAPSCVPATSFETAGAILTSAEVKALLEREEIKHLSEMMNFPGVLNKDEEVMKKIEAATALGKPVDGHAPGLRGEQAKAYIAAGISTDHECFTKDEALEKLALGMKILIREGSAAKNFEALIELLNDYEDEIMFCSDDKHPDSLVSGHINELCKRAVAKGINVFKVLKAACVNPVKHYNLNTGLLKEGDAADFVLVKDLENFEVAQTYINGTLVANEGTSLIKSITEDTINNFSCAAIAPESLVVEASRPPFSAERISVIEALDGQLITNRLSIKPQIINGKLVTDIGGDILKLVVVNRYTQQQPAIGFIKNFGIKQGAIASSVAHDSHNIIAVGVEDEHIARAINLVIKERGGISCVGNTEEKMLALPVAGLMSVSDGYEVANAYTAIDEMAKQLGSKLSAPFMTLSFMALLVIPHLKLSDQGLFDGDTFSFV